MSFVNEDIGDAHGFYKAGFGDTPDQTVFSDGMSDFTKAVTTGVADNNAGFAPIPVMWDPEILDITRKMCPVQSLLKKRTNINKVASYYRLTSRGEASFQAEMSALDEADDTRKSESKNLKIIRVTGKVSGFAQAAGMGFRNAMQEEVREKSISMQMELERAMILGDETTNPLEFDGLIELLTDNNTAVGGSITLSDVSDLIDECVLDLGIPNLLITDYKTRTDIMQQMQDYTRYVNPTVKIGYGVEALAFNGPFGPVPLVSSIYMPATSGSRRVIALDTNYIEDRILMETAYSDLAKTDDAFKFYLRRYSTMIAKFPESCGQLTGITD